MAGMFGAMRRPEMALEALLSGGISETGALPGRNPAPIEPEPEPGRLPPQLRAPAAGMFGGQPQPLNNMGGIKDALFQNAMTPKQGHKGLFPGKDWKTIAQLIGNTLMAFSANQGNPGAAAMLQHQLRMREADAEAKRNARLPMEVGGSLIQRLEDGSFATLYRPPEPFEAYASALGLTPGTPKYAEAVADYRAGAWGSPAMSGRLAMEDVRFGNRQTLQDDRQEHATGLQEDRQEHSDAQLGRRLDVTRRGQNISRENNIRSTGQSNTNNLRTTTTSRENSIRTNDTRLRTARRGRGAASNEPVAISPDGRRYVVRGGKWVPAQ